MRVDLAPKGGDLPGPRPSYQGGKRVGRREALPESHQRVGPRPKRWVGRAQHNQGSFSFLRKVAPQSLLGAPQSSFGGVSRRLSTTADISKTKPCVRV